MNNDQEVLMPNSELYQHKHTMLEVKSSRTRLRDVFMSGDMHMHIHEHES